MVEKASRLKLLLAEDDEVFRKVIRGVCEGMGFDVHEAPNGLAAKTIFDLNANEFSLIISDVRMPEMDGIQLLQHVRGRNRSVKFIIMTGFSELLEAKQAFELGANEFLSKPFRFETIQSVIELCMRSHERKEEAKQDEHLALCRIPVDEFISASILAVDLFVRLGENRFIRIANAGDKVEVDRLRTYKEKNVDYFYVRPEDLRQVVGLNLKVAKATAHQRQISEETRLKLLQSTAQLITQSWHFKDVDKESLSEAKQVLDNTINLVSESRDIMALISFLRSDGDQQYAHSVAVAVYSCMVARRLGMSSQSTLTRLSLGGLLHDIGKKELPLNVLSKSRVEMSAGEISLYETHCQRGKEILSQVAGLPEDVVQIAAHHHEHNLGTGFPYRLTHTRIHPLAKIVGMVDSFCSALQRAEAVQRQDVHEAYRKFVTLHENEYDAAGMRALGQLFSLKSGTAREIA